MSDRGAAAWLVGVCLLAASPQAWAEQAVEVKAEQVQSLATEHAALKKQSRALAAEVKRALATYKRNSRKYEAAFKKKQEPEKLIAARKELTELLALAAKQSTELKAVEAAAVAKEDAGIAAVGEVEAHAKAAKERAAALATQAREAKAAAVAAQRLLARTKVKFRSTPGAALESRRAKDKAAAAGVGEQVKAARAELKALPEPTAAAAPAAKAANCDIRKVDWKNFTYDDVALKDGSFSHGDDAEDYAETIELEGVKFHDFDKDGKEEAHVVLHYALLYEGSREAMWRLLVIEMNDACVATLRGQTENVFDSAALVEKGLAYDIPAHLNSTQRALRYVLKNDRFAPQ